MGCLAYTLNWSTLIFPIFLTVESGDEKSEKETDSKDNKESKKDKDKKKKEEKKKEKEKEKVVKAPKKPKVETLKEDLAFEVTVKDMEPLSEKLVEESREKLK